MATTKKVTAKKASTKVVSIDDAPKKIATRKKLVKVNDEVIKKAVITDAIAGVKPMNDNAMNAPDKITFSEVEKFCAENYKTNDDIDKITQYFKDNKLVYRTYCPIKEATVAARQFVAKLCYNDKGEFMHDANAIKVYCTVYDISAYLDIDFENKTFEEIYDFFMEYAIDCVVANLLAKNTWDLLCIEDIADDIISDIEKDRLSTAASIRTALVYINGITTSLSEMINKVSEDPELIKGIIEMQDKAEK